MIHSKYKLTNLINRIKCRWGFHLYNKTPIIASLDTFWMQGGIECSRCGNIHISYNEASRLIISAYNRGKERQNTNFLAYGRGVDEVIRMYGKEYVQNIIDNYK